LGAASFIFVKEPEESEVFVLFPAADVQKPHAGLREAGLFAAAPLSAYAALHALPLSGLLLLIRP
jgi:hypothetical protein